MASVNCCTQRKLQLCLLLISAWLVMWPAPVSAWGSRAHRIIAQVATHYLNSDTRREVTALLGSRSLADLADDADEWRATRPETSSWHYVNIPFHDPTYNAVRDCPAGDCVIAAIAKYQDRLAAPHERQVIRREALAFLVHFIADVHQPLHCINNNDRGGNDVEVFFFGRPTNLHAVWDVHLVLHTRLGERAYTHRIMRFLKTQEIAELQHGTVIEWALEAHAAARENAYQLPTDRQLRSGYYSAALPVLDTQLAKAGLRLAHVLNEALRPVQH